MKFQTERQTDRQTDRQTNRQTERTDRQTDRRNGQTEVAAESRRVELENGQTERTDIRNCDNIRPRHNKCPTFFRRCSFDSPFLTPKNPQNTPQHTPNIPPTYLQNISQNPIDKSGDHGRGHDLQDLGNHALPPPTAASPEVCITRTATTRYATKMFGK